MATIQTTIRWAANIDDLKANLQQGIGIVDAMKSSVDKTVASLSGNGLMQAANKTAAAILQMSDGLGVATGTMQLTEAEQQRVNSLMQAAIEKYEAMGMTAPPALQEIADATSQNATIFEQLDDKTSNFFVGLVSASAVIAGFQAAWRGVTGLISGSIDAYSAAESAQTRLTVALQTQGYAIPGLNQQYQDLARQYENTTIYSHTMIESAEALFVQLGDVGPDQMNKALQAATDLASGLGIDLNSAVEMLSKAAEGQTSSFSRYGIVLDQARVKAEGFSYVLDAVEAKVGGQAQAQVGTYAGQIAQLGNAWDDVKEKIGEAIVQNPIFEAGLQALTNALKQHQEQTEQAGTSWTHLIVSMIPGLSEFQQLYDQAEQNAQAMQDFQNAFNGAVSAIPKLQRALPPSNFFDQLKQQSKDTTAQLLDDWKKQQQAADAAAKAFASQVKSEVDSIDGADLAAKVKVLTAALVQTEAAGTTTQEGLQKLGDEAVKLMNQGADLTPQLFQIAVAFNGLLPPITDGITGLKNFGQQVSITVVTAAQLDAVADTMDKHLRDGLSSLKDVGLNETGVMTSALKQMQAQDKAQSEAAKQAQQDIKDFASALDKLGSAIGGSVGTAISDFGHMITAIQDAKKAIDAIGATGSTSLMNFTNAITAVATIASAAIGPVESLFNHFFGTAGRDAVTSFADSMGGFDSLHQQLDALGASGEQLWINLTQGVGRNDPTAAQAAINAVTTALNTANSAAQALNQSQNSTLSNLITQIQNLGGSIDPALGSYISQLQTAGLVTADNATALQNLTQSATPSYATLQALQQKYNLTLGQMGPSFQASDLDSRFQTVIDDMDTLSRGGVNVNAALVTVGADGSKSLSDLGQSVQSVIQDAITYGIAIPENMQPAAQALIDQGLLFDANGQKITDITKLNFGADMNTTLQNLNDTLKQLVDEIGNKLPAAISNVPRNVDIQFNTKVVGDTVSGIVGNGAATGGLVGRGRIIPFPAQYRAMGGPIGTDTVNTWLTPGEIVLNAAQQQSVAGSIVGGSSSSTTETLLQAILEQLRALPGAIGSPQVYIDGQEQTAKVLSAVKSMAANGQLKTRTRPGRAA